MTSLNLSIQKVGKNGYEILSSIETVLDEKSIEVKWARLGMRYVKDLSKKVKFDSVNHIEDFGAKINFYSCIDDDMEYEDIDFDDTLLDLTVDSLTQEELDASIGMSLDLRDCHDVIGGFATPSAAMAQLVFKALEISREKVKTPI